MDKDIFEELIEDAALTGKAKESIINLVEGCWPESGGPISRRKDHTLMRPEGG